MNVYENEKIKSYVGELPAEIRRVIDALNSDIGLATFLVLLKYGEMSFSQIRKELDIPPNHSSKLTYHIKKLQKSALVKNEYVKKEYAGRYSFYDITEFGEGIINNLMNAIQIPQSSTYSIQQNDEKFTHSPIAIMPLESESEDLKIPFGSPLVSQNTYRLSQSMTIC